jgi:GTP-binding protein YchF
MGFTCGIVGLPNVGKSTLFNAVTSAHAEASNYPFCTIEPNVGVVPVADDRLKGLEAMYRTGRSIPTTIEFVDIAGLVRGASRGEGLGNQFLARIREVDAIAHVVRCFEDENVVHVDGSVDPARDIGVVETELILKDLETVERRLSDAHRRAKSGEKKDQVEVSYFDSIRGHLAAGLRARCFRPPRGEEEGWRRDMHLLTDKPVLYVCNVHERDLGSEAPLTAAVRQYVSSENAPVVQVSAAVEAEIAELPAEDRGAFLRSLGLETSGLERLIREGYALLNLLTFFTVGTKEVRAWTVRSGTTAPEAGGIIHSDFERGFIRVEVMRAEDLLRLGSEHAVRDAGLLRIEGREYRVRDGDVLFYRFAV